MTKQKKFAVEDVLGPFWSDEVFGLLNGTAKVIERWSLEEALEGSTKSTELARVAKAFRTWTEDGGLDEAVQALRKGAGA